MFFSTAWTLSLNPDLQSGVTNHTQVQCCLNKCPFLMLKNRITLKSEVTL